MKTYLFAHCIYCNAENIVDEARPSTGFVPACSTCERGIDYYFVARSALQLLHARPVIFAPTVTLPVLDWSDLNETERAEFSEYISLEEQFDAEFVRLDGNAIDIGRFRGVDIVPQSVLSQAGTWFSMTSWYSGLVYEEVDDKGESVHMTAFEVIPPMAFNVGGAA